MPMSESCPAHEDAALCIDCAPKTRAGGVSRHGLQRHWDRDGVRLLPVCLRIRQAAVRSTAEAGRSVVEELKSPARMQTGNGIDTCH
jgi:hypothetical protein